MERDKTNFLFAFQTMGLTFPDGATTADPKAAGVVPTECPICGKPGKCYVNAVDGRWDCKVCAAKGNLISFLKKLFEIAHGRDVPDFAELAETRKPLTAETLRAWGIARNPLNGEWIVPGYNRPGNVVQAYRYIRTSAGWKLYACPMAGQGMFFPHSDPAAKRPKRPGKVFLCEGIWNAAALWQSMRATKGAVDGWTLDPRSTAPTAVPAGSIAGAFEIIGVPGANIFQPSWADQFAGREVCLAYDSDHPRAGATPIPPVGFAGARRVAGILNAADNPPTRLLVVLWGKDGYAPDRPSGYDLRDAFRESPPVQSVPAIFHKVAPIPEDWIAGRARGKASAGGTGIDVRSCESFRKMLNAWKKAMKWTEGLERALTTMLASIISTKAVGDQLWVKILGPASCGKSTLCDAITTARDYVRPVSTFRGFHSGYQVDREGSEDVSLINALRDKTMVTKDGDTLMKSPNIDQILSEARDIYDRNSATSYRNKMSREYRGLNLTWILCGTASLVSLDKSELGQRFLTCIIMDHIDPDLEDDVVWRIANRAIRDIGTSVDDTGNEGQVSPDMLEAMQLTGGYVTYLRENANELLTGAEARIDPEDLRTIAQIGIFVAYMRARPSTAQDETTEREFGGRLASQFVRLAACLAAVMQRPRIDNKVMAQVIQTAKDTARGRTLEIAKWLYKAGENGLESEALAVYTNQTPDSERKLLRFLKRIGAVEVFSKQKTDKHGNPVPGLSGRPRWRLTERLRRLYSIVIGKDQ